MNLPQRLLSEAELARASNRSPLYIKSARLCGLIRPQATTGTGGYLYSPDAVEQVASIAGPVMSRAGGQIKPVGVSERSYAAWIKQAQERQPAPVSHR